MERKSVAFIGSRKVPTFVSRLCKKIGKAYSDQGHIGFSGDAIGCDKDFLEEYNPELCITFHAEKGPYPNSIGWDELTPELKIKTYLQAKSVCSDFDDKPLFHQKLFARNALQVLGLMCDDPVDEVVFWAPELNGKVKGGTRIAVNIARKYGCKIYNLYHKDVYNHFSMLYDTPIKENYSIFDL